MELQENGKNHAEQKKCVKHRKHLIRTITIAFVFGLSLFAWGCSGYGGEAPSDEMGNQDTVTIEEYDKEIWAGYLPKVTVEEDGTIIQKTPYGKSKNDGDLYSKDFEDWAYYNTFILNADERGCDSCHNLRDALVTNVNHSLGYIGEYPNSDWEFWSGSDCKLCHDTWYGSIKDFAHGSHMKSDVFLEMGDSCESCHYIDDDGEFLIW